MLILRPKNTKNKGLLEFLVYRDKSRYVGVCLTLNIVEEGGDPVALMESLKEAATCHILAVVKHNLSDNLLNRYAADEYWEKYFHALDKLKPKSKLTNQNIPYTLQLPIGNMLCPMA